MNERNDPHRNATNERNDSHGHDADRDDARPRVAPSPDNAPSGSRDEAAKRTPNAREGEIRHIRDTGLPPGIRVDEAKDPGSQPPQGPVDNRS